MNKFITNADLIALIMLIIFVVIIFLIFPEKNKNNDLNTNNNQKVIKETENEKIKTTIYQNNKNTKNISKDIYLNPKIGNQLADKNDNISNKKMEENNEDYMITNIKVLDENLEEKNVFNYNSFINVVFDYSFPKGLYYFSITLDLDEGENIEISPQKDEIRKYSGSTIDKPLIFILERDNNTESIIIKNIIIKVYKVFSEEELPKYVYEHPINLTFESKKDKDVEEKEKELEEENMPEVIITPSYTGINTPTFSSNNDFDTIQEQVLTPSESMKDIKNIQTGNRNHTVADNSNILENEYTVCSKINDVLRQINISKVTKNDILKIESIIPSLELCAKNDDNAKKYLNFYFEQKKILNDTEMKNLNKGNNINEKIFNSNNNELNPENKIDDPEISNMSFVDLNIINTSPKNNEVSNLEKQEIDRNLKLQSNKKLSMNNNLLEINPLSQNIENKTRNNTINNSLIENF